MIFSAPFRTKEDSVIGRYAFGEHVSLLPGLGIKAIRDFSQFSGIILSWILLLYNLTKIPARLLMPFCKRTGKIPSLPGDLNGLKFRAYNMYKKNHGKCNSENSHLNIATR